MTDALRPPRTAPASGGRDGVNANEKIEEKTKMNKEAFVLTKVLIGKIKLHKYDQRKETKVSVKTGLVSNADCDIPS